MIGVHAGVDVMAMSISSALPWVTSQADSAPICASAHCAGRACLLGMVEKSW
ncbi:MAG: hypothetical protein R2873_19295 [Caldilineaceae bacterium]